MRAFLFLIIAFTGPLFAASRPNVLFIVVDDLHASLGCYGDATVQTPNIDRLVSRGVRFDRAYCQFTLCNPSRTSFLSGRRPETTGMIAQQRSLRKDQPDVVFLPQWFKQQGWFSAGAGKVFHKNDEASWDAYDQGETRDPQERAALDSRGKRRTLGEAGPEWTRLDGDDANTGDGIVAQFAADQMSAAVKAQRPFFVSAGFRKPHLPWTAPQRYFDQYPAAKAVIATEPEIVGVPRIALQTELFGAPAPASRAEAVAAYHACISFMDAQVGVLTRRMDELKLWENTIVVFFGDHGYHLGDHGGLWAKLTTFERCARVPLTIVMPQSAQAGQACARCVELIDLYPTLCEACGIKSPARLEGRSLLPLLAAPTAPWEHPAYTLAVHEGAMGRSLRTERWRYTEWADGVNGRELYDQDADGENYRNLADDPAQQATITALQQQLRLIPRYQGEVPDNVQSHPTKKP
jgi:iduronate 2-sulfatase